MEEPMKKRIFKRIFDTVISVLMGLSPLIIIIIQGERYWLLVSLLITIPAAFLYYVISYFD